MVGDRVEQQCESDPHGAKKIAADRLWNCDGNCYQDEARDRNQPPGAGLRRWTGCCWDFEEAESFHKVCRFIDRGPDGGKSPCVPEDLLSVAVGYPHVGPVLEPEVVELEQGPQRDRAQGERQELASVPRQP